MERGSLVAAVRWVPAVPLIGLVAACSGVTPVATIHTPPAPTSRPLPSAAPAKPSSTPSPTPAPPPQPVVVITQAVSGHTVLQAMSPDGTPLWAVPIGNQTFNVAGSRIFETDYTARRITVIDSRGYTVGSGAEPNGAIVFSPSAAEWAWSTLDSTSPSPAASSQPVAASGSFWVAGIGVAAHVVYHWKETAAAGGYAFDDLVEWSDQGLVSSPNPPGAGCSQNGQTASFVVDPSSGTRTDLASDGRGVVDVHAGVVAAFTTPQTVVLSGRTQYTWTNTPVDNDRPASQAFVSPAGTTVMVPVINTGCMGQMPEQRTVFINVADHSIAVVPGFFGRYWLDDTHAVAEVVTSNAYPELDVIGVDGTHSLLGHGDVVGVLQPV